MFAVAPRFSKTSRSSSAIDFEFEFAVACAPADEEDDDKDDDKADEEEDDKSLSAPSGGACGYTMCNQLRKLLRLSLAVLEVPELQVAQRPPRLEVAAVGHRQRRFVHLLSLSHVLTTRGCAGTGRRPHCHRHHRYRYRCRY